MKNIAFGILICGIFFSCKGKSKIVGEWVTQEKYGNSTTLIFKEDGSFVAIDSDGKVNNMGFQINNVKFELSESQKPNHLDLIFLDEDNKEVLFRIRGIVEFITDKTARIGFTSNRSQIIQMFSRPKNFEECDAQIITKK